MKKILYVTTVSRTVNAFLVPHIEMLLDKGYKVDCACSIDKSFNKKLIGRGVKVHKLPFSRNPFGINNIRAFKKLINLQKENHYDIVHVHTPIAAIYGRLLKLKYPQLKTIYTAHGYHFYKGSSKISWIIYYTIEKIMAKLTDVIININNEDYEITKTKLKPKKTYWINGVGIDLKKYGPESNIVESESWKSVKEKINLNHEDFVVLMIAELNENKNQTQLIRALSLLNEKYPSIKAVCVGEGDKLDELQKEAARWKVQDNIRFLGFRNDINDLINISNIGVLLSHREGLPRSIMEFMAKGRKVVGTKIRGCKDLIESDEVGTLVAVDNYEETAVAIENYYLNREEKFTVPSCINKYDVRNVVKELSGIYDDLNEEARLLEEKSIETMEALSKAEVV